MKNHGAIQKEDRKNLEVGHPLLNKKPGGAGSLVPLRQTSSNRGEVLGKGSEYITDEKFESVKDDDNGDGGGSWDSRGRVGQEQSDR